MMQFCYDEQIASEYIHYCKTGYSKHSILRVFYVFWLGSLFCIKVKHSRTKKFEVFQKKCALRLCIVD